MGKKFTPIKSYNINKDVLLKMYFTMIKIRDFENAITDVYSRGLMNGLAHLYIGEEAIATGVCANVTSKDYAVSTHRGHGHLIAQGADLKKMMAEVLGRKDGYCKGKGGSMHIMDASKGILGAIGIVGAGIPIATGVAYSAKYRGMDQVAVSFFGDAASNQGTFHESINMAAAWKLPVVYVCENNLFGISVDLRKVTGNPNIADRAFGYGIPGVAIDGNDVLEVYQATHTAFTRARKGEGPTLIECKTYRHKGHHVGDPGNAYRLKKELEAWKKRDPIKTFRGRLIKEKIISEKEIKILEKESRELIEKAVQFAENSPFPEPEEAYQDLFYETEGVKER